MRGQVSRDWVMRTSLPTEPNHFTRLLEVLHLLDRNANVHLYASLLQHSCKLAIDLLNISKFSTLAFGLDLSMLRAMRKRYGKSLVIYRYDGRMRAEKQSAILLHYSPPSTLSRSGIPQLLSLVEHKRWSFTNG